MRQLTRGTFLVVWIPGGLSGKAGVGAPRIQAHDNSTMRFSIPFMFSRVFMISSLMYSGMEVKRSTRGAPRSRRRVTRDTIHRTTRQKETTRQARGLEQAS